MRQFYLINADGQKYNLINDNTTAFLWQPSGLGFQYDKDYMESEGFFFEMNSAVSQVPKTGILLFYGSDPYGEYKTFMDYVYSSEGLRLAYCPKNTWYYVDIDIEFVEKSELQEDGTLQCSISMLPKTPIYLPYEMNIKLSGDIGDSIKQYDYMYAIDQELMDGCLDTHSEVKYLGESTTPVTDGGTETPTIVGWSDPLVSGNYVYYSGMFVWGKDNKWHTITPTNDDYWYRYSNTAVGGEAIIDPLPAQMNSGMEITINGEISAPVIEVYAENEKIGEIDLSSISILTGDYVKYSSIPTSAGIYQSVSGVVDDITEQIGLNADYPTFFMLPPYKTIRVVLNADTIAGTTASIKVYEYFMSV